MSQQTTLEDLIVGHSAGRLPEAVRFLIENHLELSRNSRELSKICDGVGGVMMDALPGTEVRKDLYASVLAGIEEHSTADLEVRERVMHDADLPSPLRQRLGRSIGSIEWREFSGVGEYEISPADEDGYATKLIRVRAGRAVPQHTHDGEELTLILRGAFDDITGRYERGDLAIADGHVDHRPIADESEDCLCLAVTSAPIRLSGTITRFLNPFLRF